MSVSKCRLLIAVLSVLGIVAISITASVNPGAFVFMRMLPLGDKIGHFLLFGSVAFVVTAALPPSTPRFLGGAFVAGIVILDEVYQHFVPTRSFSLVDLAASLLGVIVFSVAGALTIRQKPSPDTATFMSNS